jgi:3-oxoacyl-[acyl-carrier-protein] synthase-1
MKKIIIEKSEIVTPLGNTQETISALYEKKSAVIAENCFNLPVSLAHITDNYPQKASKIVDYYKDYGQYDSLQTLFIYSAAKGDVNKIADENYTGYSPILSEQAKQIAKDLELENCKIMVSSNACAAGAAAIDTARLFLNDGVFDKVVIFGFEQISEFTVKGFYALQAISPNGAKPFDRSRNGMSLGEGSGICVLSLAKPRIDDICVLGSGASNDANHRTGPSKTGDGLALAIERALKSANLSAREIGAIKCHGTATPYNDAMEAKALKLIFGDNIPPMVSLKGAIGHLSGAGSMIEAMIGAQFLKYGKIAPTLNFEEFEGEEKISVSNECQTMNANRILCLSAGFGGLNTAIILGKTSF